jgi:hypothetical protein
MNLMEPRCRVLQFEIVCERPPAAFGGSPPREGETGAKRARGSLLHHLETFSRGYTLSPLCG